MLIADGVDARIRSPPETPACVTQMMINHRRRGKSVSSPQLKNIRLSFELKSLL